MFLEAGPDELLDHYDLSLVEGSVTTAHDAERIRDIRARSGLLVTIGACATAGGIQALRNTADVADFARSGLRPTRLDRHTRHEHPDRRPRHGRPRAARVPDLQAPAARHDHGAARRPAAAGHRPERVRGVQAARQPVPARGGGHRLPRPDHPRRLRRPVPIAPPRLLRLLRALGSGERRRTPRGVDRSGRLRRRLAPLAADLQRRRTGVPLPPRRALRCSCGLEPRDDGRR